MARAIWKGAISFGLVYIPVELHSAARGHTIDLDYLDRRDFAPVGYQRVNKRTGKSVAWGDIVKGYQYEKGRYVALSDEDFRRANVKASRTIEILSFTDSTNITPEYFETPYYLVPSKGGEKVYTLLREALRSSEKTGIATFVIRSRQHLAALRPGERAMMLNTLRFADEIAPEEGLKLPPAGEKAAGLAARELGMAQRLIEEMSAPWKPAQYHDTYRDDIMERIKEKIRKRQTHSLEEGPAPREPRQSAQIIDLMSVLKRSLNQSQRGSEAKHESDTSTDDRPHRRTTQSRSAGRARRRRATGRPRKRA